jgi:hypothetical protein
MSLEGIITKADYERPHTLAEFDAWWLDRFAKYGETKEGRAFARESKSDLIKRFHQEAHPMLAFMRRHPPADTTRMRLSAGDAQADAVYLNVDDEVVRKFQITMAIDGRTEKLRMRQLSRVGRVDGLAKLDDNDEIPEDDLTAMDKHHRMREIAALIRTAIEKKSAKNYGEDFTLIVGVEDNTYFDEGDSRLFREFIGSFNHTFAAVHVVGVLGSVLVSYPPN